jgi:hypothetical protein
MQESVKARRKDKNKKKGMREKHEASNGNELRCVSGKRIKLT